jgi:hypothetical protein
LPADFEQRLQARTGATQRIGIFGGSWRHQRLA